MTIKVSEEILDRTWMNGDQVKIGEGISVGIMMSAAEMEEIEEKAPTFTKDDFERDLRKVSRKVKK